MGTNRLNTKTTQSILSRLPNSDRSTLWIVLISIGLRLIWAVAVPVVPDSDPAVYDFFARKLADGGSYAWADGTLTAYWPVGTSLIYSIAYRLFGQHYVSVIVLNLLVSVLLIWATMQLAHQWFGRRVAILTGLLLAIWPAQIQFTTVLASELIFTALVMLAIAVWQNETLPLWPRVIVVGPTIALASYVRPTALLIPVLLLIFRWINTQAFFKTLVATLLVFVLMGGLFAPWVIRNMQVFGEPVLISTNGGVNFWMGNNPASDGGYMPIPDDFENLPEVERNDRLKSLAIEHIKQDPLLFIARSFRRLIDTHSRETIGIAWNQAGLTRRYGTWVLMPLKVVSQLFWILVLGLSLVGIIRLGQEWGWLAAIVHPTVLIWAYYALIHVITVSGDRYHFPSAPMIAVLAALTIRDIIRRTKRPSTTSPVKGFKT